MKYLMQYLVVLSFLISSTAWGGLFEPDLDEVLFTSVSGYIYIDYESSTKYTDNEYADLIVNTLVKDMNQAALECEKNKQILKYDSGALDYSVKEIYDSLKIGNEFDDYKIISAILLKYTNNSDDIFFQADYREDHPECIGAKRSQKCENFKEDYYFDEDTPINGSVLRSLDGGADPKIECQTLMDKLFPKRNNVCSELKHLKSCLAETSKIDDMLGTQRRSHGEQRTGINSVFDKFLTQESLFDR
jgi:hypothetical protein